MNIRMDSKAVRVRISQDEISALLQRGVLNEEIALPLYTLSFRVTFAERTRVSQQENVVTFWLSPEVRDKLKSLSQGRDPIATVYDESKGSRVCFELEVDVFTAKKREQRI